MRTTEDRVDMPPNKSRRVVRPILMVAGGVVTIAVLIFVAPYIPNTTIRAAIVLPVLVGAGYTVMEGLRMLVKARKLAQPKERRFVFIPGWVRDALEFIEPHARVKPCFGTVSSLDLGDGMSIKDPKMYLVRHPLVATIGYLPLGLDLTPEDTGAFIYCSRQHGTILFVDSRREPQGVAPYGYLRDRGGCRVTIYTVNSSNPDL